MKNRDDMQYDLVVVGGGSGGFAAAWTASRMGLKVCLIEKSDMLGGTSVRGGVNSWEPVAGATGVPFDLYRYMMEHFPDDIAIHRIGRHAVFHDPESSEPKFPGGERVIDPDAGYFQTLQRSGTKGLRNDSKRCQEQWCGVVYEPTRMHQAMTELLEKTGQCDLRMQTAFSQVQHSNGNIDQLLLSDGQTVSGRFYLDGTADGLLCHAAGCEMHLGEDPKSRYDEPSAPEHPTENINGVTLVFRITPVTEPTIEVKPTDIPQACWWRDQYPMACFFQYPNGDVNVNMLPTMEGQDFRTLGYEAAIKECHRRIRAYWHNLQTRHAEFQHYRIHSISQGLGVRESYRVVCEYMLTEMDLRAGLNAQTHSDIIAMADHALDTHGRHIAHGCAELQEPFGIPLRCLLPKGIGNLLVACRASGFSSLSASSCRLSRTMMQLGQAAACAVAIAVESKDSLLNLSGQRVQKILRKQHVALDWPYSKSILDHVKNNGCQG